MIKPPNSRPHAGHPPFVTQALRNLFAPFLLLFSIWLTVVAQAQGTTLVLPQGYENVEGGGVIGGALEGPRRTQLIFGAQNFTEAMPEGAMITGIAFRLDGRQGNSVNGVVEDFEVRLSTTPSLMASVPFPWEMIAGSGELTVFPRGPWQVRAENLPGDGPNPFTLSITFARPFPYDPRNGNLLVDLIQYERGQPLGGALLDVEGSSSTRVYTGGFSGAVSGGPAYVTQLQYQPVPEPSPLLMLLVALASMAAFSKMKRTTKE